jgi:hypothetical protein
MRVVYLHQFSAQICTDFYAACRAGLPGLPCRIWSLIYRTAAGKFALSRILSEEKPTILFLEIIGAKNFIASKSPDESISSIFLRFN